MFQIFILVILAIVPITILLKSVFEKDTIEKESMPLLFELFLSGTVCAVVVLALTNFAKSLIHAENIFYLSFFQTAFIEEICKWLFVFFITWRHKEFNYKFDAIVYCVFVSLGFAFVENLGYCLNYGMTTALLRAIIAVPGHAFFAIYMGYYLGSAKYYFSRRSRNDGLLAILYSILVPILLHGIYNYCLFGQNDGLYLLFLGFVVSLYVVTIKTLNLSSSMDVSLNSYEEKSIS